jgi:CRP-like cAMP-binding protein
LAVRKDNEEREPFVILEGVFEVFQGTRRIAIRTKGDLIGEIAFFTQAGQRTASVRALTNGRVLVLQHEFLKEFNLSDPEAGYQIMMNMNRVMAERLAEMMQAL